jgi:flagellar biosynthesis protein FlhA
MADNSVTPAQKGTAGELQAVFRNIFRSDVALGLGIIAIIVMLILPMPSWLLDMALAISISLSVLVLMTALFIKSPLEFTSFPSVLLIATMLRLGLNVASTRLILAEGHQGPDAAGQVIEAFGSFVMQGNFVIGVIVFIILVIVNFVVITKGSGRIAEVAARFTLDAMPGKQMAIDADLSSGLINEAEAKKRRKDLESESNFFGAMDGASKFVRGDAMAGILITGINIVAGIVIGIMQHNMAAGDAASTYAILTIGDGLVSQIPALIISIAAGLLVSKAGVEGAADKALARQLSGYPQALALVGGICIVAGLLPGMPPLPFFALATLAFFTAWTINAKSQREATEIAAGVAAERAAEQENEATRDEPISQALAMDEIKLELGFALLPLINEVEGRRLTDQIKALRRALASDMGFVMPSVRILDNLQLNESEYVLRIKEIEAGRGALDIHALLVMDPQGIEIDLPGRRVKEPAFGLPAMWIEKALREEANFRGLTVVDPATVLATHLTEVMKEHMADLLSFSAMDKLFADLPEAHKKLLEDMVPSQITRSGLHRILQGLLRERVSIRDLPTILEAIAEASSTTSDLLQIGEHVRARLARSLCSAHSAPDGFLPMITLSAQWEQAFAESLIGDGSEKQLALAPSKLHEFVQSVRRAFDDSASGGDIPVLLTSPMVRPYVRSLIERFRPQTTVMSQNEIHPRAKLRSLGSV